MPTTTVPITLYWRPGCPFCAGLQSQLDSSGVPYEDVNIWEDSQGAAFVRSVNDGNELVPTLTVGDRSLSNPQIGQVLAAVHEQDPETDLPAPPEPTRLARGINRLLGGA
ncbi:glutaredoxin domain-containing protein [Euzebya tangerina]|uniref:glutaredoxin domain-containing protein n=1 Tax=Euzebya tangerina TaxID=591198 RepID=UPI000E31E7DA|nr:glutaredoxin domain-containing protein [Euzebya tangerina]